MLMRFAVIYLTSTMGLGTLSVCFTVVVLNLHYRDSERRMPGWLYLILLVYIGRFIGGIDRRQRRVTVKTAASWSVRDLHKEPHQLGHRLCEHHLFRDNSFLDRSTTARVRCSSSVDRGFRCGHLANGSSLDRSSHVQLLNSTMDSYGLYSNSVNEITGNRTSQSSEFFFNAPAITTAVMTTVANNEQSSTTNGNCSRPKNLTVSGTRCRHRVDGCPLHGQRLLNSGGRDVESCVGNGRPGTDRRCRLSHCSRHSEESVDGDAALSDWKDAAKVLDRLFFLLVFFAMTASMLVIVLIPVYKGDTELTLD